MFFRTTSKKPEGIVGFFQIDLEKNRCKEDRRRKGQKLHND